MYDNEIVALLGRSGSGKSTLLRIVSGLMPPSGGEVSIDGQPVKGPADGLAMVFQSFALFPWLTVQENVELGLEAQGVPPEERRKRALAAIDLIGLDGFETAYPKELSGGMRQRVGLARALVVNPKLLLMDEPFSALDVLTAETLRTDFLDLWCEGRMPIRGILLVTHNIEEAVLMSDRILVFSSNPGRVIAEIKVNLPQPRNRVDPAFRALVDDIYARMTAKAAPAREGLFPGTGISMSLPHVSTNTLAGLLETLAEPPFNGRADLPLLAERAQMEVDELFHAAETLQLLRFAELAEGDLQLNDAGRRFARRWHRRAQGAVRAAPRDLCAARRAYQAHPGGAAEPPGAPSSASRTSLRTTCRKRTPRRRCTPSSTGRATPRCWPSTAKPAWSASTTRG